MQIAFDWQAEGASGAADFVDAETAPFGEWPDNKAESDAIDGIVFGNVPGESAVRSEPLQMENGIRIGRCFASSGDVADDVFRKKIVSR